MHYCGIQCTLWYEWKLMSSKWCFKNLFAKSDHHRCEELHSLIFLFQSCDSVQKSLGDPLVFFLHILHRTHASKVKQINKLFYKYLFDRNICYDLPRCLSIIIKIIFIVVNETFFSDRPKCLVTLHVETLTKLLLVALLKTMTPWRVVFKRNNKQKRERIWQHLRYFKSLLNVRDVHKFCKCFLSK